jgi:glycyl-tRNA synthetase (class II)
MIVREVIRDGYHKPGHRDRLRCTQCNRTYRVDHLEDILLTKVTHDCTHDVWTVRLR